MKKKRGAAIYKELLAALTNRDFMKKTLIKKKTVIAFLEKEYWLEAIDVIIKGEEISCLTVLSYCEKMLSLSLEILSEKGKGFWLGIKRYAWLR